MQVLVVVDAQNEFSAAGVRAVPNHAEAWSVFVIGLRRLAGRAALLPGCGITTSQTNHEPSFREHGERSCPAA